MSDRQRFFDQIKAAERDCRVVDAAILHYRPAVRSGKAKMPAESSPRDLDAIADHVEATYLIWMWASFETALRSYHEARTGDDRIRAVDLINWAASLGQKLSIPNDIQALVHEVRNYRNTLIHGGSAPPVSIEQARRRLNTMLHCLPMRW